MYFRLFLLFFIAIFSNLLIGQSVAEPTDSIKKHPAAPWVIYHPVKLPDALPLDEIKGGSYYALVDNQIRVTEGSTEFYSHYADLIVNQQGLEQSSQINIKFDPAYQTAVLNTLRIRRGKKVIDKLSDARTSILRQESELENLIYNGRLTANIILDDVRVGDIIEYSYTLKGANPVYSNIFSYDRFIEWSTPIHQQKIRVLWGKQTPLHVTTRNTPIKVKKTTSGAFKEYRAETSDAKTRTVNNQIPNWYSPYGAVYFNEVESWADVAQWALPLYENAIETGPQIRKIRNEIRSQYKSRDQQIIQALKIVQGNIRYLGIETGENSHRPTPASQTLQRRYGDCKDKTVLFISILKSLGIPARPALVSTSNTAALADQPPSVDAFNHVMVKVWHNDEIFWIDPTRQYQNNTLSTIYQPDYRYALVVDKKTQQLEKINNDPAKTRLEINEYFDLSNGGGSDATFKVESQYYGYDAERLRYQTAGEGLKSIQDSYLEFYRSYYISVEPAEKLSISEQQDTQNSDAPISGPITQKEHYLLKKFWETNTEKEQYEASFYATSILTGLQKPDQTKRNSPYRFRHPNNINQTIEVLFRPGSWSFEDEESTEDNAFFYFHYTSKYNTKTNTLKLSYELKSRTDHIAVKDLDAYLEARKRVRKHTEFSIIEYFKSSSSQNSDKTVSDDTTTQSDESTNTGQESDSTVEPDLDATQITIYSIMALYIIAMLYIFINWYLDFKKQPAFENAAFYPVSLIKLMALTFSTFGIYPVYWFYRNWKYAKTADKSSIMPIARGIFNLFWFYPLYRRLVKDSNERYQKNNVLIFPLAVLFAAIYFIAYPLIFNDYLSLPALLAIPLLLLPLANYINHIETADNSAYRYNSRWLARHTATALLFIPLSAYTFFSDLNILPSEKVIEGSRIAERDIKYMQRKGIIPASEKIIYFYSDALFNMRDDGNGFTENHVFSYWDDDESGFTFQTEKLSQIKKIDIVLAKNIFEDTIITIVREDDSEFLLYVSGTKRLDRKFIRELKYRWKKSRAR